MSNFESTFLKHRALLKEHFMLNENAEYEGKLDKLINHLKEAGIYAVFHYLSLHRSPYYTPQYEGGDLPHADRFTDCLLRLPMFFELRDEDVHDICDCIATWIQQNSD